MNITSGEALEYRVAKIAFNLGYFSRKRIAVRSRFYPERIDVSDIDVMGIKFDPTFRKHTAIWECRSGQVKTVDTILWLIGMAKYVGSDSKIVVKPKVSERIKTFGESVGVLTWDDDLLASLERIFNNSNLGFLHNPEKQHIKSVEYYRIIKNNSNLNKIYWFEKCNFWFEPPDIRLKQTIDAIQHCQYEITGHTSMITEIAQELLFEGVVLCSMAILDFAGRLHIWQSSKLRDRVSDTLKGGLGSPREREGLIKAVSDYVSALKGTKLPHSAQSQIDVPPPKYTDHLVDNLERMYEHPNAAIEVPRFLDVLINDYIIPKNDIDKNNLENIFGRDISILAKMSKNVIVFLDRAIGFPKEIIQPLLNM